MIRLAIRRPVATAAIYVALFALGAYSFRLIPVEDVPEVAFPQLTVTASWSGASPEAMEAFVTAPLEAVIQQIGQVEEIVSESSADGRGGGSTTRIQVDFERDTRMEFARLELSERISSIREELPPGVGRTVAVSEYVPEEFAEEDRPFLVYSLTGPYTFARLGQIAEEEIEPRVRGITGVSEIAVQGAERREIAIELDRGRLEALGLRPETVQQRIRELSTPRAPGSVELDGRQVAISVRTRALDVSDLEDMIVMARESGPVRVRDLGRVRDQTEDARFFWRIDGEPTISLRIYRQSGTNAIRLAEVVRSALDEIAPILPAGARLELQHDESEDIQEQLTDLRLRAAAAAIVIFLVLMLFLRSLGAVLVVFATIGFSVLIAINFLYWGGFSLNLLTLAGLAWGFGLVVDNGIVVLENVERHRRLGKEGSDAAEDGARQVVLPVLAATLTTAIVLVPFLFLQGELRVYYLPLSFAVGFSIIASLFVAFTLVPALAARIARRRGGAAVAGPGPSEDPGAEPGWSAGAPAGGGTPFYIRGYRGLLQFGLRHPIVVAFVCAGCLFGSWRLFDTYVTTGAVWGGFGGNDTYIQIFIEFPRGAGLDRTDELARSFEARLSTIPEVERYETQVWANYASIEAYFPDELEMTSVPVAIKDQMVAYSYGFSGVDVRVYGFGPSFYGGGSSPPNYRLQVLGYNYLTVQDIAEELAGRLERFSRIRDVDPNASGRFTTDKEFEYFVEPDREALAAYDISVQEILNFVASNIRGAPPTDRIRVGGEEVQYAVKVDGYRDFDFYDLAELRVPISTTEEVLLSRVAEVGQREVLASIRRENQQYERTVAWEFRGPRKLGDLVRDAVVDAMELPPGYRIEEETWGSWSDEDRLQMWLVLGFSVLLIYMVTAGLFESLAAPFVVLFTLPLALIGVFLIFFYTDATFTRTAFIGTIMMGGIVVNNAILVVYHIGELRERMPTLEAIVQGTLERVRPILMTTLTTVFGLLPLVLFASSQDENIWNALALATIGGLISSTIFVLVAIPVAYRYLVARGA